MHTHDDRTGSPETGHRTTSGERHPDADSELRQQLGDAAEDAKSKAKEQGEHYRDVAADNVDAVADSARAAAGQLDDDALGGELSRHITDLADGMSRFSAGLRDKSADEMISDLRRTAREHPAMFLAGSVALGFGISRFAQASSHSESRSARGDTARAGNGGAVPPQGQRVRPGDPRDVARAAAAGQRDGRTPPGTGAPLDSRPDASAADAADRHPRPPYGAPSEEDQRHD